QAIVSMLADATLQLRAGTTVVFDLDVNSAMAIFSGGVVARFTVTQSAGPANSLDLAVVSGMTFSFEVNTSSSGVTLPGSTAQIAPGVRVIATGSFTLLNGFTMDGDFTFTTGTQTINGASQAVMFMTAGATLEVLAGTVRVFNLDVTSSLLIWSSGVA